MTFLYGIRDCYYITNMPLREFRVKYPGVELISQFATIQAALQYCEKRRFSVKNLLKKSYTGITPEGRERMREKKLGDNNPNADGLSEEHKRKIAQALKKRRGEFHHMYNQKHRLSSRIKTSMSLRRLPKRRWCLGPDGREHLQFCYLPLPEGYVWGRRRKR